jgi:hypothetical protein
MLFASTLAMAQYDEGQYQILRALYGTARSNVDVWVANSQLQRLLPILADHWESREENGAAGISEFVTPLTCGFGEISKTRWFSPKQKTKPGPKGPTANLTRAVIEMKQRNPTWCCLHIADQINLAFGTSIIETASLSW